MLLHACLKRAVLGIFVSGHLQGSGSTQLSLEKLAVQLLSIEEVSQLLRQVRTAQQYVLQQYIL
jgi:hypothetical protein